jgi:Icc-related predicted phosphoesterase
MIIFAKRTIADNMPHGSAIDSTSIGVQSTIIFLGDIQRTNFWERNLLFREQNDTERQLVVNTVAKENPALLLILGDLVSCGGNKNAWNYFDECTKPLRQQNIPMIAIPGNHEYFCGKKKGITNFLAHFPQLEGKTWTSVKLSYLGIILFNSNFSRMSAEMLDSQKIWYERTIDTLQNDSSISMIIVGCHASPFTNSTIVSESDEVQTRFLPKFFSTPKAKLFISGHCHSYERFIENGKTFVVSGGAGGPRQKVITNPTKQRRHDYFQGPPIRPFHYCKIEMGKDFVRVQMVKLDDLSGHWSIGEEFSLQRN